MLQGDCWRLNLNSSFVRKHTAEQGIDGLAFSYQLVKVKTDSFMSQHH